MDMLELADQLDSLPVAPTGRCADPVTGVGMPAATHAVSRTRGAEAGTVLSSTLYGSFFLARTEFALPVEVIQEVVVFPERVTAIPLSPAFLVGVFNLRGTIIPIIDLRAILGMTDSIARESQKIAIVDFANTRVGLVFDATGEMLRVQPTDRHPFHYADDDPSHVVHRVARHVVKGALKLAGGERLVQILDPAELMMIEQVPQILDKQRAGSASRRLAKMQRRQCVSFRLGDAALAFEIAAIHEIIRVPDVQDSVLHSDVCVGMFNLRGDVIPLVDFGALLGMTRDRTGGGSAVGNKTGSNKTDGSKTDGNKTGAIRSADMDDEHRIIVMRFGEHSVGLLVDCVESIVGFAAEEVLPIPSIGARRSGMFKGCITREGHADIVLLAHETLLSGSEIAELTQGHSRLYARGEGHGAKQRQRGERHVYITFRLDNLMAVPIGGVREIIRYTDDFMTPPGLPAAVRGILNLRRRLVTIVDLRSLYGLPSRADDAASNANAKILIVERGDDAYGLIVDTVENIVHVYASDKLPVPSIMMDASQKSLRADLTEIVEVPKPAGAQEAAPVVMMIFDVARLTDRIATTLDA